MTSAERFIIRKATAEDCEQLLSLIEEEYAREETKASLDVATLQKSLFGEERFVHCFVAVLQGNPCDTRHHASDEHKRQNAMTQGNTSDTRDHTIDDHKTSDYHKTSEGHKISDEHKRQIEVLQDNIVNTREHSSNEFKRQNAAIQGNLGHTRQHTSDEHKPENVRTEKLVGFALYLFYYSEGRGPYVMLENLYASATGTTEGGCITPKLMRAVARVAVEETSLRLNWVRSGGQNDSRVDHDPGGTTDRTTQEDTVVFQLDEEGIKRLASSGSNNVEHGDHVINIRAARPRDCDDIIAMMKGLAIHEGKSPSVIQLNADDLRRDGFGPNKRFYCHVADNSSGHVVGYTLHVLHYSVPEGVSIFMQDLFVASEHRGHGIGSMLLQNLAKKATQRGYKKIRWTALGSNKEAIKFYSRKDATNCTDKYDTHYMALGGDRLKAFAFP